MSDGGHAGEARKWWTLVAMTGALSMIMIDMTVVSVALPTIQRDLGLSATSLQWVVNAYLLALAVLVAVGGHVSDALGRRTTFLIGVVAFTFASGTAGLSNVAGSGELLLAARAVQGVGAAMMIPSSQAVVTNAFPLEERGRAMGVYAGISMGFLALGPLIGGLLTEHAGWEWVFYVNVPVAFVTIALTIYARPENTRVPSTGRFDWTGTGMLVVGLGAVVFALMQSSSWGWSHPVVIGLMAFGTVSVVAFVAVELHVKNPLVHLRVFQSGNFATDSLVLFLVQFCLIGISVFGAIYAQDVLGFSPVEAGLALFPLTIPVLMLASTAGKTYDRVGPRPLVSAGSALVAAGFFATGAFVLKLDYWWLVPGYVILGAGVAFIMTPANTDGMNAAPAALRGQAAGVLQTVRQVGGTVGIAVLTTIINSVNRSRLNTDLADAGITGTEAKELEGLLTQAQGGDEQAATEIAKVSGDDLGAVIDASKDAFAGALEVAYFVLGTVMVLAAIVAAWKLRRVDYAAEDRVEPHPVADHAHPRGVAVA